MDDNENNDINNEKLFQKSNRNFYPKNIKFNSNEIENKEENHDKNKDMNKIENTIENKIDNKYINKYLNKIPVKTIKKENRFKANKIENKKKKKMIIYIILKKI